MELDQARSHIDEIRHGVVLAGRKGQTSDDYTAQIEAFEDTWHWTSVTETQYDQFVQTVKMTE